MTVHTIDAALTVGQQHLPHIGRHAEIAALHHLFSLSPAEQPGAVSIAGSVATGKTRLLYEGLAGLPSTYSAPIVCTCRRLQQPVPYWPLQAAWRSAGHEVLNGERGWRDPAGYVEDWATRLATGLGVRPSVLVLDAAQWADPWTLRVLDALLSATFGPPPLLWITWRPREGAAELAVLLDEAEQMRGCLHLSVDTLGEHDVRQGLAAHLPPDDADALTTWLNAATAGLPDLVACSIDALAREDIIRVRPTRWQLDTTLLRNRYPDGRLPAEVCGLLRRRICHLPSSARDVLEVITMLEGNSTPALLDRICGTAGFEGLDDLVAMRLLRVRVDEWGVSYSLTIPALGEVVLEQVSNARRVHLTARIDGT